MNVHRKIETAIAVLAGMAVGLGTYTFVYAKGYSYLSNNPAACANCHVMRNQHDGWIKSSHRAVATCNDCHTPHDLLGKYSIKTMNGFFHSLAFTSGRFPDVIEIKDRNRRVTEAACRYCHEDIVQEMGAGGRLERVPCISCHATVGHV
jgi:cytochrome c nitrite reductase small subunit